MVAIPRIAPRMPRNSESRSENALFTLRAFFQNWGGSQVSESGKSPESLRKASKESFRTVRETFWRLSGVPWPEAPGDIFETFSPFWARSGLVPIITAQLHNGSRTTYVIQNNRGCP